MAPNEILIIQNLSDFEKKINRDQRPYDINMMVMPGTLEDKHKDVDPVKGIPALRRQFNLIYLLLGGVHDVYLGADYQWLKPNDLVIVPENYIYASKNVNACHGYCMHFKSEFILPLLSKPITEEFSYLSIDAPHIIHVTDHESILVQQAFKDIIQEYERFSPEKESILRHYIHILLLRIKEIYKPHFFQINLGASRPMKLTAEFKRLVEKNIMKIREVSKYASMMHISPNYLSDVIRSQTGRSPKDIINDLLLLESKILLRSTDLTISQIAHQLEFNDHTHFTHFIKAQAGLSPVELRKKL
jgi:AraC family transcriptional regulator, transcriptional activator of pobA